ncbi:hypothetical protein E0L36_02080 [Streptomyces sp. AJS327]|uniref:hypothetical protein n=1 Tax=Streptomyces sp. AJS327 TaxID=2545265 RepID=UPI0015DECC17|nr:hypothetical protein [Streptomyces sp. AJS327]MBA0049733.1 hypothetical protein [Streptomyces sp. AJS327]
MRRTPRLLLAGAALTGAALLTAPASASAASAGPTAWPTGCAYAKHTSTMTLATCTHHNGGSYRAHADCKDPDTGKVKTFVGDWRQTGDSKAYCGGATRVKTAGIETTARDMT